jgi:hypothetical protein
MSRFGRRCRKITTLRLMLEEGAAASTVGAAASTVEDEPALPMSHERFLTNPVRAH